MARRQLAESVRLGASGLVPKVARRGGARDEGKAVDVAGAMGAIGIVEIVRRCR